MADSHHIIDGKVVPYSGGRKCNDTDAWRDATPLELQLQEQLEEYERTTDAQEAEIEALRAEVGETKEVAVRAMRQRDAQYNRAERLAEALREAYRQVRELCDCYGHVYPEASFVRYEALLRAQEEGE